MSTYILCGVKLSAFNIRRLLRLQICDFHPLTEVSEPPAGIQRTVLYVSHAFTEQSQHASQQDMRKNGLFFKNDFEF